VVVDSEHRSDGPPFLGNRDIHVEPRHVVLKDQS
jgi:hypothetical protein